MHNQKKVDKKVLNEGDRPIFSDYTYIVILAIKDPVENVASLLLKQLQ